MDGSINTFGGWWRVRFSHALTLSSRPSANNPDVEKSFKLSSTNGYSVCGWSIERKSCKTMRRGVQLSLLQNTKDTLKSFHHCHYRWRQNVPDRESFVKFSAALLLTFYTIDIENHCKLPFEDDAPTVSITVFFLWLSYVKTGLCPGQDFKTLVYGKRQIGRKYFSTLRLFIILIVFFPGIRFVDKRRSRG